MNPQYLFSTALLIVSGFYPLATLGAQKAPTELKTVKVFLLEALSPRDTTSSESFRIEFESSIELSKRLISDRLSRCGYAIETQVDLYDASDQLQAHERAMEAEKNGTWLIIGPRRSNHYLLVAKGAPNTPSVSLMASSSEVEKLGPMHLSVYPGNSSLAHAAARVAKGLTEKQNSATYFNVVNDDCLTCKDFATHFDDHARAYGLKKLGSLGVVGENPDPTPVVEAVLKSNPNLVLLPNYSKSSAILMGAIHTALPKVRFIGGDGWGDQKFGFMEKNPAVKSAPGITVRGFPPAEIGLAQFKLGKAALSGHKNDTFVPSSGPGMAILRIFEGLTETLCRAKPSDIETFRSDFLTSGKKLFSSPWGISAYRVSSGRITYWKAIR